MKILFFSHYFYPVIGGIETNSEILAQAFFDAGHEVHLLTWTKETGEKNFPYKIIRNPSALKLLQEFRWAQVVFENNPCMRLAWPNLIFNRPSVIALNTWLSRVDGSIGLQDKLKQLWLKRAGKVIAVSNAIRLRCWKDAEVIQNPYKVDTFRTLSSVKKEIKFVFLGRLVSDKGADMAVKAIDQLYKEGLFGEIPVDGILLTIIGDGPEREPLKELASRLGVINHINFKGSLRGEELVKCLNKHQYILIPSVWEEPFGSVALEGMACGCLPVASDGGGLPDAVGDAGRTFKRGDLNSLSETILQIVSDKALELRLRNATAKHLSKHRPEEVSKRYLAVLNDVYHKSRDN